MVHDTKWWYVNPNAPCSKVMYNTLIDIEYMEDVASYNEDDVKHANENVVVDDQEIRDPHDNETSMPFLMIMRMTLPLMMMVMLMRMMGHRYHYQWTYYQ